MPRRHAGFFFAVATAILGVVLAVIGAGSLASRQSDASGDLDRQLTTSASEKAAEVATELERARALALLTARIPPFGEFYADAGTQAARIAAVAGPRREITEALTYLWQLYPDRVVEAGYVDLDGSEIARVVRGHVVPTEKLLPDVRDWPSYAVGASTPTGSAAISAQFRSPTAGVSVVAATAPVTVNGSIRAYVEIEVSLAPVAAILQGNVRAGRVLAVVDRSGAVVAPSAHRLTSLLAASGKSLEDSSAAATGMLQGWRFATSPVPTVRGVRDPWTVVSASRAPTMSDSLRTAPGEAALLTIAAVLLIVAGLLLRRYRSAAAAVLAAEQSARAEAEQRSRTDPLTGLFNRRHVLETIEHELARAERTASTVGIVMVDADHFKCINDQYGHAGGDAALVEMAARIRDAVREWDTVARVGGEEFCIVAPGVADEDDLVELAERVRTAVRRAPVAITPNVMRSVTVSAGVAILDPHGLSPETAMDLADRALYAAKHAGRDAVRRLSQLSNEESRHGDIDGLEIAEALATRLAEALKLPEDAVLSTQLGELISELARLESGTPSVVAASVADAHGRQPNNPPRQ